MRDGARNGRPSVLALIGDITGSSLWRILQPVTALENAGYPCGWDRFSAAGIGQLGAAADIVILTRLSWKLEHAAEGAAWFTLAQRKGQTVIYELDDDLLSTAHTARGLRVEHEEGKTLAVLRSERQANLWTLSQCDGVTVSTPYLADVVRRFTEKPVIVVPNAIDVPWFRSVLRGARRHKQAVTIGWAGGRRDDADLAPVAEAWRRVAARYPAVRFVVAGWRSHQLCSAVPQDRCVFRPWLPIERYPSVLAGITIGCAAVEDEPFNRSKSAIKAMEYALAGAAVVATPCVYGELVNDGETGRLAETADEWEAALSELVERPAVAAMLAKRLARVVERDWSLAANLTNWPRAWAEIQADARARRGEHVVA